MWTKRYERTTHLSIWRMRPRKKPPKSRNYMKPGLRGRYLVQSPKSRVDIKSMGNVIRIPCSTAMLKAISLAPGRNAETFEALLSAAKAMAVLKAVASASGRETARGPMWPLLLT